MVEASREGEARMTDVLLFAALALWMLWLAYRVFTDRLDTVERFAVCLALLAAAAFHTVDALKAWVAR
jgi:low temperature requirement protein LtrA